MKLYWRFKKDGKWTFTSYEGFDDVWNLYTLSNIDYSEWNGYEERYQMMNSDCAEMMLTDYRRVLSIQSSQAEKALDGASPPASEGK